MFFSFDQVPLTCPCDFSTEVCHPQNNLIITSKEFGNSAVETITPDVEKSLTPARKMLFVKGRCPGEGGGQLLSRYENEDKCLYYAGPTTHTKKDPVPRTM